MKFPQQLFMLLTVFLAMLLQTSLLLAEEIPGYIGVQSFHLMDDPQLSDLTRRVEDHKNEVARIDQTRAQFEDQIRVIEHQKNDQIEKMNLIQRDIDGLRSVKGTLEATLAELNKSPVINAAQISSTMAAIAATNQSIDEKSRLLGQAKIELGPINSRLEQVRADYSVVLRRSQEANARLQMIARDRENYRQNLISSIQYINRDGAGKGQGDGANDGFSLARKLGYDIGNRDGDADGFNQGTVDGQDRYYRRGAEQGEKDGASRAQFDGERDGTKLGVVNGNKSAGSREGNIAGIQRAEASDAAAVGTAQGKTAGMDRAVKTGSIKGREIGEKESVLKFESGVLNTINLNGPFAGSFQRRSPNYPGDFNGPNFNPNIYDNRDILRRAFADGYVYKYREFTRYEYLRRIDGEYNMAYDNTFSNAYNDAVNREYPDYYNRGRNEADARAYSRDYPIVKAHAYEKAFKETDTNPSRSSVEYKTNFASSEVAAFNERYELIRRAKFDKAELDTFNNNIASQSEIYQKKRISEVTNVYNNNAVLSFVNSEMFDGGINGIAAHDGIFQPGETTLHSVAIRNFGFKAAKNVSVKLDDGALVKLPEIPARSLAIVKGAGISQIESNMAIGSTVKSSLMVTSSLTSNDAIEALHFDNIKEGVLKIADQKSVRVVYPLTLSNLAFSSQLLKGVTNKLAVTVTNNSKRSHNGELKVKVLVNSQNAIVTKEFGILSSIQSNSQLSDAEVLVNEDADIYRDLSFSASITQNGVVLGVLGSDMIAMAKATYAEKNKLPVLVANSNRNLRAFQDSLSVLGGTEKVSILDLSLANLNAKILSEGLNQKVMLVADDENGSNIKELNSFVGKSKTSTFVFIDEFNKGLKNALTIASSKDAQKVLWDKKVVMFTNQHRAEGVLKSSAMFQSTLNGFDKDLALAFDLTLSSNDLMNKLQSEINRNSFFTPSNTIKMFSMKTMAEILCINKAYAESGGIFSRDKKWAEMVTNDETLLINILKKASDGNISESQLSAVLPAIALKDTISNAMSSAEGISGEMTIKISSVTNKVLNNMEDAFKKNLKKFDKDLYNKAYEKASIHRPFHIASTDTDTN